MARRTLSRLTAAEVKKLSKIPGRHSDGGGLYLQVDARSGSASWVYRTLFDGRERYAGLGPFPTVTLKEAREKALAFRKLRVDGRDPLGERQAARQAAKAASAKALTFWECATSYISAHRVGWKNAKHTGQWSTTLETYVLPVFGTLPVAEIDTALVMKAIEPIWTSKPETASRVRGRIENVLDWAKARGYRDGENPARWRGHLQNLLPKKSKIKRVEHLAAMPYAALPNFMAELRKQESIAARALEFLILVAGRSGEVRGARWSEIDVANRVWIIPGDRMKVGKEHRVPLADRPLAIVEQLAAIRESEFVFPGQPGRRLDDTAMLSLLHRLGQPVTAHGFRACFRVWAAEVSSFAHEVVEAALAHTVSDQVVAAYRRTTFFDRRRALMAAWAGFCASDADKSKVVALH